LKSKYQFVEFLIQGLILLSLVTFSIETLPNLSENERKILYGIEIFTIAAFTIEYLMRIILSNNKLSYIFSFYGIIDILSVLPFYIGLGIDLRSLRALRLFRLLRLFKLARYSKAIQRFHRAFIISKEEIVLFFLSACIMLYLAGVGIYFFENKAQPEVFASVFDGLWWAVATLTTVGYGDCYPITVGGKIFTFFILIIGLGIIAVPTGMVASALAKARAMEEDDKYELASKDE
jgi:voltage-gated potassium channel